MNKRLVEIIGWYGTFAIVGAYALVSFNILTADNIWYQFLNLTGALGIVLDTLSKKDYQPGVLNIIWLVIALVAILKIAFHF